MRRGSVDIKISTLVKKMDSWLKNRKIPELKDKEFWNTIKISVDMFLTENGYPFYQQPPYILQISQQRGDTCIYTSPWTDKASGEI